MFKDSQELKDFITWAKSQKIYHFKVGEVEIQFTPIAMIDEDEYEPKNIPVTEDISDEELLEWSARG